MLFGISITLAAACRAGPWPRARPPIPVAIWSAFSPRSQPRNEKAGRPHVRPLHMNLFCGARARGLVRERQIGPQIVEICRGVALGGIIALAAEDHEVAKQIGLPDGSSSASANDVVYEKRAVRVQGYGRKGAVLVDIAGALPPDPFPAALLVFPDVIEESSGVRADRAVSPTAKEPEIVIGVPPAHCAPP
jgi:hypothetical protein